MFAGIERFRQRLEQGKPCLGAGITLSDSAVVEALAPAVDFFWIDLEHSHLSYESVQSHLIAARAGGTAALVRVRGSDVAHIKPVLDIGAEGIIVPQVTSADEVRSIVAHCRYAPQGRRGYGPRRPADYGRNGGAQYMARANRLLFVAVQIENRAALGEVDAIADVEGLDGIALGPNDLAIDLGHAHDLTHPDVDAALRRIIAAARKGGKYVGSGMGSYAPQALDLLSMGVEWLQCGDDYGYMVTFADEFMQQVRDQRGR